MLKWGERLKGSEIGMPAQAVAQEGFLLLGERCRTNEDKEFIKKTLSSTFKCKLESN